jgi:arginyl-tRNA--protein-N-Asp/Glu arginylyltransferase
MSEKKISRNTYYTNVPPQDALVTNLIPVTTQLPTLRGPKIFLVKDVLSWALSGQLIGYEYNRGGYESGDKKFPKLEPAKIKKLMNNYDPNCISEIAFAWVVKEIGTAPVAQLADSHHRVQVFMNLYWAGLMQNNWLQESVSVRVTNDNFQDNHKKVYVGYGQAKSHSSRDCLKNPDLCMGSILQVSIIPNLSENAQKLMSHSCFHSSIGNCVYALDKDKVHLDWTFNKVYGVRGVVKELLLEESGKHTPSQRAIEKIVAAIHNYAEWYELFTRKLESVKASAKKVSHSSQWFQFFMYDQLKTTPRLPKIKTLVGRCCNKLDVLITSVPNLAHGSGPIVEQRVEDLYKTLGCK